MLGVTKQGTTAEPNYGYGLLIGSGSVTMSAGINLELSESAKIGGTLSLGSMADVSQSIYLASTTGAGTGFSNFIVTGDSGTTTTITNGETLHIDGGTGITTDGSVDGTVSISLTNNPTNLTSLLNSSGTSIGANTTNQMSFSTTGSNIFGPVTASTDISSSGIVTATQINSDGMILSAGQLVVYQSGTTCLLGNTSGRTEIDAGSNGIKLDSNVTASNNISASGAIYMSQSIGTDNSVVVLSDGKLVTDEIDSRVWGTTLVDGTNGTNNEIAIFTDSNSVEGDSNLTWDGSTLLTGGTVSASLLRSSGDVIAYYTSDERLKDDIEVIANPLEKINKLKGVSYRWNGKQDIYPVGDKDSGIIAQDVEAVLPELVQTNPNGYLGVKHDRLVGLLIEGIKEQQKQLDALKLEVKQLKGDD